MDGLIRKAYKRRRAILRRARARKSQQLTKRERMQLARVEQQINRREMREARPGLTRMKLKLRVLEKQERAIRRLADRLSMPRVYVADFTKSASLPLGLMFGRAV